MGLKPRKPTWRQQAIRALTESIAHWTRMRDGKQGENETPYSCACCRVWIDDDCDRCPIALRADPGCIDTPYHAALVAWLHDRRVFPAAAQVEIDYLAETLAMVRRGEIKPWSK